MKSNITSRNSSIELLRILLMGFIVMHHVVSSVIAPAFSSHAWACLDVFLHTAVIVFVLISGYFNINFSWKRLATLVLQVAFYSVILSVTVAFIEDNYDWTEVVLSFMTFSNNFYWFVTVYLQLYLVSYFLNILFKHCSDKEFLVLLCVMAFFVFYLGFLRRNAICSDGKNLTNFIFIYQIGYGIRRFHTWFENRNKQVYVAFSIMLTIIFLCFFLPDRQNLFVHAVVFLYKYNSPFLILLSVLIFLLFINLRINSRLINYFASSSFCIYLIHEHPSFREYVYIKPFRELMASGIDDFNLLLIVLFFAFILSFFCMLVDKIRISIFSIFFK